MFKSRHPEPSKRPSFKEVKEMLFFSASSLLQWTREDTSSNPEVLKVGSSLQFAEYLFIDLQNTYKNAN